MSYYMLSLVQPHLLLDGLHFKLCLFQDQPMELELELHELVFKQTELEMDAVKEQMRLYKGQYIGAHSRATA